MSEIINHHLYNNKIYKIIETLSENLPPRTGLSIDQVKPLCPPEIGDRELQLVLGNLRAEGKIIVDSINHGYQIICFHAHKGPVSMRVRDSFRKPF